MVCFCLGSHHHHYQSLYREGRWGTTDDFATSFLHFSLFSTALWDLPNSGPVHSLMLSSHIFLCLPCPLPPFTVPCKMVVARPDERELGSHCREWRIIIMNSRSGGVGCRLSFHSQFDCLMGVVGWVWVGFQYNGLHHGVGIVNLGMIAQLERLSPHYRFWWFSEEWESLLG